MTMDDGALPGLATARVTLQDSYDRAMAAAAITSHETPGRSLSKPKLTRSRTVLGMNNEESQGFKNDSPGMPEESNLLKLVRSE